MAEKKMKRAAAISYDGKDDAPQLIGKGSGIIADKIIETAREKEIPIYQDEELVESLNKLELGEYIPPELYKVVAEILIFVTDLDELHDKLS